MRTAEGVGRGFTPLEGKIFQNENYSTMRNIKLSSFSCYRFSVSKGCKCFTQ